MKKIALSGAAALLFIVASLYATTWYIGMNKPISDHLKNVKTKLDNTQHSPTPKMNRVVAQDNVKTDTQPENNKETTATTSSTVKAASPIIIKPSSQKVSAPKPANTQVDIVPSGNVVQAPAISKSEPITLPTTPTIRIQLNSRASLTSDQQRVYDLVDAVIKNETIGAILIPGCNFATLQIAFSAVKNDHPEYFWSSDSFLYSSNPNNSIYFGIQYTDPNGKVYGGYLYDSAQVSSIKEKIGQVLQTALAQVNSDMTPYQKELVLHDWLVKQVTYNYAAVTNPENNKDAFTIYGALINNSAVCEGYSKAYQLIMYALNIPCTVVTGFSLSQGPHMWNEVQLNGLWYGLDTTWDDTNSEEVLHSYFNISDAQMSLDHIIAKEATDPSILNALPNSNNVYYNTGRPICSSMNENYAVLNGTFINSSSDWQNIIPTKIATAANAGQHTLEFLIGSQYNYLFNSSQTVNDIDPQIIAANRTISVQNLIKSFSVIGPSGGKGFIINW